MTRRRRDSYGDFQVEQVDGVWLILDREDGGYVASPMPYTTTDSVHAHAYPVFEDASRVAEILWQGRKGRPWCLFGHRWIERPGKPGSYLCRKCGRPAW